MGKDFGLQEVARCTTLVLKHSSVLVLLLLVYVISILCLLSESAEGMLHKLI